MLKPPQAETDAIWKQRYRTNGLWRAEIARRAPSRGMVISSVSGTGQIYAWDVFSGVQRQLTYRQEGTFVGSLSPDGNYIYYLRPDGAIC